MSSLTRAEAAQRSSLLAVTRMQVDLDLDRGAEEFGSRTRILFSCSVPGAGTFADLSPIELRSATLNGTPLDPDDLTDGRLPLRGLAEDNVLELESVMAYSRDGQGLHRASDPADGQHYVYGHLFLDAAPRVFACFDQPDLKAPYAVTVTAPAGWTVLGNGAATEVAPRRWRLAETQPLATYFVTVCAGPYASVRAEHDGIPLGLHARASLQEALEREAPQMLEVTRQCFDYYHSLFGIRYPFGEYHQVFVPEFNAGAMENPGCVTFRDTMVFRGAAARDEVLARANTIAHEMAHMWFGDLVTMRWWDDLWLNESFAEYMGHRACVDATEFDDAWVDFTMARKAWGYAAERTPSTHPVAGSPAPDARKALQDFDGISYAKGASVLRQLIAHIGDEAFVAGVTAYLRDHAFGNGTLAEFVAAIERSSGTSLGAWTDGWLLTAGVDVLSADVTTGVVNRAVPARYPANRPHSLDIAGYSAGREVFRVPVRIDEDQARVPSLAQSPVADLVIPNASDLTWATVLLDAPTLEALPAHLARVPDPQARAVVWVALVDGVYLGEVDPRRLVQTFGASWALEDNSSVLSRTATALLGRVVPCFVPPERQVWAEEVVAGAARAALDTAEPGSTKALLAARTLARSTADEPLLRSWVEGTQLPAGLEGDSDFRWLVVRSLAARGGLTRDEIEAIRRQDDTLQGHLGALHAWAARPVADAKEWAWQQLTTNRERSNYELNALAQGFWHTTDLTLVRHYVERYFVDIPAMAQWVGDDALARVARLSYPARVVEARTAELSTSALAGQGLTAGVRRAVVDGDSELHEALRSRAAFRDEPSRGRG